MSANITDRFALLFGDRRGLDGYPEAEAPIVLAADLREPELWWFDAENNPVQGGSHMDLRRWLDSSLESGHGWLEAWLMGTPGQSATRTWTIETWEKPGQKRRQRALRQRELDWLESAWPANLWWRVDKGAGYPLIRGGLVTPQPH